MASTTLINVDPDITTLFNDFFARLLPAENSFDGKALIETGKINDLLDQYLQNIDCIFGLDSDAGTFK